MSNKTSCVSPVSPVDIIGDVLLVGLFRTYFPFKWFTLCYGQIIAVFDPPGPFFGSLVTALCALAGRAGRPADRVRPRPPATEWLRSPGGGITLRCNTILADRGPDRYSPRRGGANSINRSVDQYTHPLASYIGRERPVERVRVDVLVERLRYLGPQFGLPAPASWLSFIGSHRDRFYTVPTARKVK